MTTTRVLVTGGAGFIGSHTAERFAREGYQVRILDDLSSGDRANCDPAWDLQVGDVRDPAAVEQAARDAEVVVHLAAFISVPESFERFADCYRSNVWGSYAVLQACLHQGVRKLVFASSSAVYAELPDAPKRESECPQPISPYAVSKLEGEHLLDAFAEAHGLASTALRFFNVYGPRQPADSAYAAAVPIFMERGVRGEPCTIYGDGQQTRDFVFVADVADAIFQAARSDATGVYNVGTGRPVTVLDLADAIATLTGSGAEHRFEASRAGDVRSSTAAIERIRAAVGWSPLHSLEQGLDQTQEWYRRRLGR
jgi:UDP-glucose 4-epimerase